MTGIRKILLLSVKAGAGHMRAAEALMQAFQAYPEIDVLHLDALQYTNPAFRQSFIHGYEHLAKDLPSLWGYLYDSLEEGRAGRQFKRLSTLFGQLNTRPLRRMVDQFDPDGIVCTHYAPAEVLAPRRKNGRLRATLHVVLTDYDIHAMWLQHGIDHYHVATEEMAFALSMKEYGEDTVHVSGIPVMPDFNADYPDRAAMRERLGLIPERPTVLVTAGGYGLIKIDQIVPILAQRLPQAQFLAVAGRNENLRRKLDKAAAEQPESIVSFGFVENMHELMAASDFIVAKSGGLTVSEAMAMGLPMVIVKPIPGQEERNATWVLERGAGVWAHTHGHLVYKVERLLKEPERLARMQQTARAIGRPDAADRIADTVLHGAE